MKKLMIAAVLGSIVLSCKQGSRHTVAVCAQASLVSEAVSKVASPAPKRATDHARERREPVLLLRILTEL